MIKILFVAGELTGGGYQRQLHLLLRQLDRRSILPILAVWRYDPCQAMATAFQKLDISIYSVARKGNRLQRLWDLYRIIKEVQPHYIHSYCFYTNFPVWLTARVSRVKGLIGSMRNDYWHEIAESGALLGRFCARYPRLMIVNNKKIANTILCQRTIFRPAKIWVVPNAVDTETFHPDQAPRANSDNLVRLLGVGRLSAQKRWVWLFPILKELIQSRKLPQWHFTICGEGEDFGRLKRQLVEFGLEDYISLVGYQKDIVAWLRASDLLLLCSAYEGRPNVVAEALSCGVPVLSTDVGDMRELVRDGIEGYVVGVDDRLIFRERLSELIRKPTLRYQMGQNGRNLVLRLHSASTLLENTLRVYQEAGWSVPLREDIDEK